jgi:predicted phage baseplate assembly protein
MQWGDLVVAGDARRARIRERHGNGVDAVEVHEGGRGLLVFFLEHAPRDLRRGNVRIDAPPGARPVRAVELRRATESDRELEDRLIVVLDQSGSAGSYRLSIVAEQPDGTPGTRPHHGIDPRYSGAEFVFDVDAPRALIVAAPNGRPGGDDSVSYLARDYEALRQLMFDRLAVTIPDWTERHIPDIWITLVELLAYVGDDLSYYEDAVATEAYLQTARRRVSIRRHARLVDYRLHEGCNARTWVCLEVSAPVALPLDRVRFAAVGAYLYDRPPLIDAATFGADTLASFQQYSPLAARPGVAAGAVAQLYPAHGGIQLWSWGEPDSHLTVGATSAFLVDGAPATDESGTPKRQLELRAGDVILLEETADPTAPGVGPSDPSHRQLVRLTDVRRRVDALYGQPLMEVRWAPEDALTFELAVMAGGKSCGQASGNVVLVAHGVRCDEPLQLANPSLKHAGLSHSTPFPDPALVASHQARALRALYHEWRRELLEWQAAAVEGEPLSEHRMERLRRLLGEEQLERAGLSSSQADVAAIALAELLARSDRLLARRRRRLELLAQLAEASGPLEDVLMAELVEDWGPELTAALAPGTAGASGPAAAALEQDPRAALPLLTLADGAGHSWAPSLDLIGVMPDARAFVAEVDDQGIAALRFSHPPGGAAISASYWIGNGARGNAELAAINALVWLPAAAGTGTGPARQAATPAGVTAVRNPLPVTGGIAQESTADARNAIPGAFLQDQQRALTSADYEALAAAVPGVRRAAAQMRFTGSATIVDVAIQPAVGEDPEPTLLALVQRMLDGARRIGHRVRVVAPRYRPLIVELNVALQPDAIRAVAAAHLARLLSSGWLPDGTAALFNPEGLAFAGTVYVSPIIAGVHAVAGVQSVTLTRFGFLDAPPATTATEAAASLTVGTLELARLDNDPAKPERGYALVKLEGGR